MPAAFEKLRDALTRLAFTEHSDPTCDQIGYTVWLSSDRRLRSFSFSKFLEVLHNFPRPESVHTHSHWKGKQTGIALDIDIWPSKIEVGVSGDLAIIPGIHDSIRDIFHACNPVDEKSRTLARHTLRKSVFLAHRFDSVGKATARTLSTFLSRLGFHVVEGEGYESRDIPTKVAERIQAQDIFLLLVTPGDTSWVLSEAAYAKGLGKYLVILVQDDVSFKKGIIGSDHEHISFPSGIVEKSYNDLLFAVP